MFFRAYICAYPVQHMFCRAYGAVYSLRYRGIGVKNKRRRRLLTFGGVPAVRADRKITAVHTPAPLPLTYKE